MIVESIALGLVVGLLVYEGVGYSPGGLIVPGYLALFLLEPGPVALTVGLGLLTAAVVRLLGEHLVLFGRRRFVLAVLLGFVLARAAEALPLPALPTGGADLRVIGFVVPGLIANDVAHQGVAATLVTLVAVAALVRALLVGLVRAGLLVG
jgi:poly-gamma-glutamate biosynthesis protein PgsC/CapC